MSLFNLQIHRLWSFRIRTSVLLMVAVSEGHGVMQGGDIRASVLVTQTRALCPEARDSLVSLHTDCHNPNS